MTTCVANGVKETHIIITIIIFKSKLIWNQINKYLIYQINHLFWKRKQQMVTNLWF